MHKVEIDPGVIKIFRWLVGFELVFTTLNRVLALFVVQTIPYPHWLLFMLAPVGLAILLLYLTLKPIPRLLGDWFLPLPLAAISIFPLLNQHLLMPMELGEMKNASLVAAWQMFPLLFVPFVFTTWQYRMRGVLLFTLVTTSLDLALTLQRSPEGYFSLVAVIMTRTFSFLLVGAILSQLVKMQMLQRRALEAANSQLLVYAAALEDLSTSRERNRLARELHDTLAHTLTAVSVQLEAVKVLMEESPPQARDQLDDVLATTRSGLTETRRALQALRASPLEDMGLPLALRALANGAAARAGVEVSVEVPDRTDAIPGGVAQAIYRTVQESLENIVRHASARQVLIKLKGTDGRFELVIEDDGSGFDMQSVEGSDRLGLRGMQERAQVLGAHFSVDSQPGNGTRVHLSWEQTS